jgi:hypothetical protein
MIQCPSNYSLLYAGILLEGGIVSYDSILVGYFGILQEELSNTDR